MSTISMIHLVCEAKRLLKYHLRSRKQDSAIARKWHISILLIANMSPWHHLRFNITLLDM